MKKRGPSSKRPGRGGGESSLHDEQDAGAETRDAEASDEEKKDNVIEVPRIVPKDPLSEFFVGEDERVALEQAFVSGGSTGASRGARTTVELLSFWVADEEYALEIVEIQEIIKLPTITEVPRVGAAMLGIISLRGTIVPVLDLRLLLHLEARPVTRQHRILVLQAGGDPVGLLVDRVASVVRVDGDSIEPTPRAMKGRASELVRGVGRVGGRLIIVLDVNAVLNVVESAA